MNIFIPKKIIANIYTKNILKTNSFVFKNQLVFLSNIVYKNFVKAF